MFNIKEINAAARQYDKEKKFCDEVVEKSKRGILLEDAIKTSQDCEEKQKLIARLNKLK